ncbi:7687_t:CDS:2 [Funneliformis caledonium]|uniref:7687_t:CDS:1 n=1 Tax=Funneliformis caledonium TaxID=1117310 RepID=A0A9N9I141_9GLOM|nr:7687_t:CDS:2 [Funneliformis caledonium]
MSDSPSPYIASNSSSTRFLRDDEISQHSSITIEPARKSIIINEDSKSTSRGSEATREVVAKKSLTL